MSRKVSLPKIDERKAEQLLQQLRRMAPHYTSEWPAKDNDDPGVALLKVFSVIAEGVISRLNRAPDRNFLAFLDMLGIRLLQATPAQVAVRFLLATGTEAPFLIPKGAQVTAAANAERLTELPFETIKNLWAIPAILTDLFTVDPEKDHIYKPPSEFLKLEKVEADLPLLRTTAFSARDSKFLQLDPPDQVKKDDFLRIDQKVEDLTSSTGCPPPSIDAAELGAADHLVVADAKGSIITVTDPLPRDYVEGTSVRKVTDFELFEGRNWQEHILYLGHADYFAIKSEAKLELEVEQAGSDVNLEPLNVVWEFFGVTETLKEDGWHRFEVDTDGTLGFSRSGTIVLNKPAGEIKENEINGRKSRWIRARLDGPLPATPARLLPAIESLTFKVSSTGKNLELDQAFHNDTPLTTNIQFFPFGTEPRIFDRFSMASEEVFSKLGAEVELDFELDATDLLAAPVAVVANDTVRVFAHAAAGRLVEFQIDPRTVSAPVIKKHDIPPDTRIVAGSIPSVVVDSADRVGIFVRAADKKVYLRSVSGDVGRWIPFDAPPGELQFNPSAVFINNTWQVFVVADGQLFSKAVISSNPDAVPNTWTAHPVGPQINSSPFAVDLVTRAAAFITDVNGKTWKFDPFPTPVWTPLTPTTGPDPDLYLSAPNARPYVKPNTTLTEFRIFLRNKDDRVVVIDTDPLGSDDDFGPPNGSPVDSNPTFSVTENRVYVRTKDNHLWSRRDLPFDTWTPYLSPSGFSLVSDPFALEFTSSLGDFTSVFSTSDKNSLLEFRISGDDVRGPFKLQAGPLDIVKLENNVPNSGTFYIHITDGSGSNSDNDAVRKLDPGLTLHKFAVLTTPLNEPASFDTRYDLLEELGTGTLQSVTSTTLIKLAASAVSNLGVAALDYVFVDDSSAIHLRQIDSVDSTTDEVQFTSTEALPSTVVPGNTYTYFILRLVPGTENNHATDQSAHFATLDSGANPTNNAYNDLFIEITTGPGQNPFGRKIVDYDGPNRTVEIGEDFGVYPNKTSDFRITVSSLSQGWFVFRDPDQSELRPELSWEYFNGRGWVALKLSDDGTSRFLTKGIVKFIIPADIEKTEVAGQENYWIRARIVGGDYGRELFSVDKDNKIKIEKDPIRPPLVKKLAIGYKLTERKSPQVCLTFNNLNYLDQTAANDTVDKHFKPYLTLEDANKAIYFGFDRSFESGPVGFYFAAKELEVDERDKPTLTWELASDNTWKQLSAVDGTEAFTKPEFVSLTVPPGFQNSEQFGKAQYWLRATLTKGNWKDSPLFKGVFPNTVAAMQARTVRNEILGSSTAIKDQKFRFQQVPVIEGEEVRVLEFLTESEREELLKKEGKDAVLTITDQRGDVLQTWIRWTEVIEFFDSKPESRHYRLDRHTGEIEFGDGVHGRIPPAGGDDIQAFAYQTGGGAAGNVKEGEITSAVTAVTGVESVINPVPAGGGSDAATNEEMLEIGPAQISHRDRAVTPEDFERLAHKASREVRKALCLPNRNAGGRHEVGWTSVHIVPASKEPKPLPSLELRRSVQRYLAARADLTLVDQDHIFVGPPRYVPVNVEITAVAKSLDEVATAEQSVRQKLEAFLHPLTGGPTNEGWQFGRDLAASDLYALLEDIDSVDHVTKLRMVFGDTASEERVEVESDALLASGTHRIEMGFATENI